MAPLALLFVLLLRLCLSFILYEKKDRFFGNAYKGDRGVPHAHPERFRNIWIGLLAFSAITWFNPYIWQLSNQS
ncbi:hypothetical protein MKX03_026904, partial [Papaver bracteatum]